MNEPNDRALVRLLRAAGPQRFMGTFGPYRVVHFRPEHAHAIVERGFDVSNAKSVRGRPGPAFSVLRGGEVTACAGAVPLWPGVCTGWALTSAGVYGCGCFFTELVRRSIDWLRRRGFHRVQADVLMSFPAAARWARHLGFEFEGVAWALGPNGEDYFRYGRVL